MPLTKLKEYLDNNNIKYVTISHSPAYTAQGVAAARGVDIIIAQGGEGGGHCGEVGSIVLWPQVVAEVAPRPVLAAGVDAQMAQLSAQIGLDLNAAIPDAFAGQFAVHRGRLRRPSWRLGR